MTTQTLIAPAGLTGKVQTPAGNYTIDADGFVSVEAQYVPDLLGAGFSLPSLPVESQPIGANGLVTTNLPLIGLKNAAGTTIAASAAAGVFGISITPGTSEALTSETANDNTKTDKALGEYVLPANYAAGENVTITVNALVSGALSTKTIDCEAWIVSTEGACGSDICGTAAQSMTTSAADYAFVLDGTDLVPGSKIMFLLTMVLTEAATVNQTGKINSVRLG